jgi:transcriptional regulator with XRE-family HTH domain
MSKNIKEQFEELIALKSPEEKIEHDAQILAFQFLSKVDLAMSELNISKKMLAKKVGTSPSFITQLFRGDRKPNWNILAKMQQELNLEFKLFTKKELDELIANEIKDYHRNWNKTSNGWIPITND